MNNNLLTRISELFKGSHCAQKLIDYIQSGSKRVRLWFLVQLAITENAFTSFNQLYTGRAKNKPADPKVLTLILLAKEILGYKSDTDVLEAFRTDTELQQMAGIKDPKDVPSRRTLIRFRKRLEKHYNKTGENLMEKEIISLMNAIQCDRHQSACVFRIDSTPIQAFLRKTNRMQLIYLTIATFVKSMDKNEVAVPDSLKHYLNPRERNRIFYHKNRAKGVSKSEAKRNKEKRNRKTKEMLLRDIKTVLGMDQRELQKLDFHRIFLRMVDEHTYLTKAGNLQLKPDCQLHSRTMQSPFDEDATFRKKAGKNFVGYAINFVEVVNVDELGKPTSKNIIYYQVEQNVYSDSEFLKDFLSQFQKLDRECYLVADGAYYSYENQELAKERNLILVPTEMAGKETKEFFSEFVLSDDGREFISCPGGAVPRKATYNEKSESIYLSFPIKTCQDCPFKDQCKPNFKKRVASMTVSKKSVNRARMAKNMRSEDLRFLADIRNGVESIPSQLKNTYNVNRIRQHGLFSTKLECSFKILALEMTKLSNTWIRECFEEFKSDCFT